MTKKSQPPLSKPSRLDVMLHRWIHRERDRGASLIEYSLIFSLVVVAGIGGAKYLSTQGTSQVANQANCIAVRPPATTVVGQAACVMPALTSSTTSTVVAVTSTFPTTTALTASSSDIVGGNFSKGSTWTIANSNFQISISPSPNNFSGPVTAQFAVKQTNAPTIYVNATCTPSSPPITSPVTCTLPLTTLQYTTGTVVVSVQQITSDPSATPPSNQQTWT